MKFIKVDDQGNTTYPYSLDDLKADHPNTSFDAAFSDIADFGVHPVVTTGTPDFTPPQSAVEGVPIFNADLERWETTWQVIDPTAEEVDAYIAARKTELLAQVSKKRLEVMATGCAYTFPDGIAGHAQTRDSTDTGNINGIVTTALILKSSGVTSVFTEFNDAENVEHPLTPDQAITFGMTVGAWVSRQYKVKWTKEAQVAAIATLDDLAAFDITTGGWGE
jgi:hypothetical protein